MNQKQNHPNYSNFLSNLFSEVKGKGNPEYLADVKNYSNRVLTREAGRFELAEEAFELDKKWPGRDWFDFGCYMLKTFYKAKGLSDDEVKNMLPVKP